MSGISIKLPINLDGHSGNYSLNKNYRDVVKQNFKHLMLTAPGERVMDPNFGVGLRALLFEPDDVGLEAEITSRIQEQINSYMPYISITDISFTSLAFNELSGPHTLSIRLDYEVDSLDIADFLDIEV
jgi:phage baseplate assembly protein W